MAGYRRWTSQPLAPRLPVQRTPQRRRILGTGIGSRFSPQADPAGRTGKPDVEIYRKMIDFYNIDPAGIFFTDDLEKNINSAKELNISAFKFDGLKKLKEDLNSVGVVV